MAKGKKRKGNVCSAAKGKDIKKRFGMRSRQYRSWRKKCK